MLQKLFNILFADTDDDADCYLECAINHDSIHAGYTLVLSEHEDGLCIGRAIRVRVTGIIEDTASDKYEYCDETRLLMCDNNHITKQKTETWSIPAFMI